MSRLDAGPVSLSGVVLSNVNAAPTRSLPSLTPALPAVAPKPVVMGAPAWVPMADLSQKPQPPALDTSLLRNYPAEHRRNGTPGDASVELMLSENGSVASARVTRESAPGFGDACRRTLLPSRWSPPLDRSGRAVKTRVTYRCRFTVGS
jgi:TonB family protein